MKLPNKPKLKKPALPKRGQKSPDSPATKAPVTNKTINEHRDEVIGKARKYIYPTHTRRHIVTVSVSLLVAAIVVFLVVCGLLLYKFQNNSTFIYRVTQVVPFPVAKAGDSYVSYENYLFEVRHYVHYYQYRSQLPVDFSTQSGQNQLNHYKHQALQQVIDLAYTKQLAKENDVKVTAQDVNSRLAVAKERLGRDNQEFASVLQSFWGWSTSDYKRELKSEILMEKVASKLDTGAHRKANTVLDELNSGVKFSTLAKKYSDDKATSARAGVYPELISQKNTDLAPQVVAAAFKLKTGQTSSVIDTGYSLEILKKVGVKQGALQLAHIQISLALISKFIKPLEAANPDSQYITLPKS